MGLLLARELDCQILRDPVVGFSRDGRDAPVTVDRSLLGLDHRREDGNAVVGVPRRFEAELARREVVGAGYGAMDRLDPHREAVRVVQIACDRLAQILRDPAGMDAVTIRRRRNIVAHGLKLAPVGLGELANEGRPRADEVKGGKTWSCAGKNGSLLLRK